MNARFLPPCVTLLALVYCGGATTSVNQGGPGDGGSSSSGGSGGGTSSGGSSGGGSSGASSSGTSSGGSSGATSSSGGTSSGGSSSGTFDAGPCQSTFAGGPRTAPSQHRTSTTCAPSAGGCLASYDAGNAGMACTSDADCAADGGTGAFDPYTVCLRGHCAVDNCLDDTDCPSGQVCSCSSDFYGGNACVHRNSCIPANCHVDGDCGAGAYCVPSTGYCGTPNGFYCNEPTDPCMDPATDCSCGSNGGFTTPAACQYEPTVGKFVCAQATVCAG